MELSERSSMRGCADWLLPAALLLLVGCPSEQQTTGVRIAIRYGAVPARLRVAGHSDRGVQYGPALLPDPPRALARDGETVLVQLRDDLDGRILQLDVAGLDAQGTVMALGSERVRVVKGSIAQLAIQLGGEQGCTDGVQLGDGGCASLPGDGGVPGGQGPTDGGSGTDGPIIVLPDAGKSETGMPEVEPMEPTVGGAESVPPTEPSAETDAGCGMTCATAGSAGMPPAMPDAGRPPPPPPPPPPSCGDGTCQAANGENACSCSKDCGASMCGDGVCCAAAGENACSCAKDCGASACGDGVCCAAAGENACSCAKDCGASKCGDGMCCAAAGENACSCAKDCGASTCGDAVCCAPTEDKCSCAKDCGTGSCGDGVCCAASGENSCSCAKDCGASTCGDGVCCAASGENTCACPGDCGGSTCGDGLCCNAGGEDACTCNKDCPGICASACTAATCTFNCENAASCVASCSGSSDCTIRCKDAKDCSGVVCSAPAKCAIDCTNATNCVFAVCPTGAMSCPKNRIVCNQPCPG
jgi:hypothetical protein